MTSLDSVPLRLAGTWDALLQCLHLDRCLLGSPRDRKQRNYKWIKIAACTLQSKGKLGTTRYKKTKNPTATSEEPGAKAGGWEQKQGTSHAPCTHHHLKVGKQSKSALQLDPWTLDTPGDPYPHRPLGSEQTREHVVSSCSPLHRLQQGPQ